MRLTEILELDGASLDELSDEELANLILDRQRERKGLNALGGKKKQKATQDAKSKTVKKGLKAIEHLSPEQLKELGIL